MRDASAAEAPPSSRRSFIAPRTLAAWAAVLGVVLVLVAFVAYRELIHYERVARRHVPSGATFALRVDLEQVVLFEPVRRHLLALADRLPLGDAALEPGRLTRLRERAGLNLGLDLRELVFAQMRDGGWVLALGGLFEQRGMPERVTAVLREEPGVVSRREGAALVLAPSGLALAQAADGVLVLGSSASLVSAALGETRAADDLGLDARGAAAAAALPSWIERDSGAASLLPTLQRARVALELGDPLELTAVVELAGDAEPARVEAALRRWLAIPEARDGFVPGADWAGERALAARARSRAEGHSVVLTTEWAYADLDRACTSLAAWLEARWALAGPRARGPRP